MKNINEMTFKELVELELTIKERKKQINKYFPINCEDCFFEIFKDCYLIYKIESCFGESYNATCITIDLDPIEEPIVDISLISLKNEEFKNLTKINKETYEKVYKLASELDGKLEKFQIELDNKLKQFRIEFEKISEKFKNTCLGEIIKLLE